VYTLKHHKIYIYFRNVKSFTELISSRKPDAKSLKIQDVKNFVRTFQRKDPFFVCNVSRLLASGDKNFYVGINSYIQ